MGLCVLATYSLKYKLSLPDISYKLYQSALQNVSTTVKSDDIKMIKSPGLNQFNKVLTIL